MACFFDSNVLVYALDPGAGNRHGSALRLVERHLLAGSFIISTQVLLETYAVLTRKLGVDAAAAHAGLSPLAQEKVVGADAALVLQAMALAAEQQLSIWDALIVAAALAAGCDTLFSEDFQAGRRFDDLQVVNPFTLAAHEPSAAPARRTTRPTPVRRRSPA